MFKNIYKRIKLISKIDFRSTDAKIRIGENVELYIDHTAEIILNGGPLLLAVPLQNGAPFSSKNKSIFTMKKNSKIIVDGPVIFAPGFDLRVGKNAVLHLKGKNTFGHDSMLFCNNKIILNEGASTSWNCTLMDDDGHDSYIENDIIKKKQPRPLILGKDVGLQMHVIIPRGVTIGDNSQIGAATVVRENIQSNVLAYQKEPLTIKYGTKIITE